MTPLPVDGDENEKNEIADFTMETRKAPPSHLVIKIESFSLLSKHGIEKFESREFTAGDYQWSLMIYLDRDDISADLAVSRTSSLPVGWESSVVGTWSRKVQRFNAVKSKWGLSKFISKKSMEDPSNGFLVDDNCVFGAEVFVIKSQQVIECVSVLNPVNPYKRDWRIPNLSKLEGVWTSEEFTSGDHKWKIEFYPNGKGSEIG